MDVLVDQGVARHQLSSKAVQLIDQVDKAGWQLLRKVGLASLTGARQTKRFPDEQKHITGTARVKATLSQSGHRAVVAGSRVECARCLRSSWPRKALECLAEGCVEGCVAAPASVDLAHRSHRIVRYMCVPYCEGCGGWSWRNPCERCAR